MENEVDELKRTIGRLREAIKHRDDWITALCEALEPLTQISDAYHANDLDDEARRFWGENNEHENRTLPENILLVTGRGGKTFLTLRHCFDAKQAVDYC